MGGYPSTNIEWVNNSIRSSVPATNSIRDKAILMTASSSDKGYEDLRVFEGSRSDFENVYGKISYAKYGQEQIQAAAILDAGAALYHQRIVSATSKLAHIGLAITVTKTETQKTNDEGGLLYVDSDGNETTAADGNTPIIIKGAKLKYETAVVDGDELLKSGNNIKDIASKIKATYTDWATADLDKSDSITFPWFVAFETGRGVSKKKIKITPDYTSSKSSSWTKYSLTVLEDNTSIDNVLLFSMDPSVIDAVSGENRAIDTVVNSRSKQLRCVAFEDSVERLFAYMSKILGVTESYLKEHDILFARTRKGYAIDNITIDTAGVSLTNTLGIDLLNGDNGALGDYPKESVEYEGLLKAVFDGTSSLDIYDINNRRVNAIFDANYPASVKRVIEGLVDFRQDIFYFRDLGLDLRSVDEIIAADVDSLKSKFCASYHNSYDIYEPSSRKQVSVTCMYDLAAKFVSHENGGVDRPFAGLLYGITFNDSHIIQDTINFIPRKTPGYDQIESLKDANINYMVKYNGVLTMDTEYTSDEVDSDFSYINNILAIQDLIRIIRVQCPKTRYTFKSGDDYTSYKKDVEALINTKQSSFDSLSIEFLTDEEQKDSNAIYAAISVSCRDFIDKEYFKIIAI